jgi:glycosyltransferase involved in cell wall biosynthesis
MGDGRTLLLYAGRVSREKGLDRLAAGYLALRRRRDDVHLVIAGDGPYRGELEAMLGTSATFTGFLRSEELARVYASCDLFAFPSTTDTLGRAVAEAQASGLPAVVCGMGGPRECIQPGVSGFVVDPGDEEAFFSRVELLAEDPGLRERMGLAAREFAASMSWRAALDNLIESHSRLIGRRTRDAGRRHPAPRL